MGRRMPEFLLTKRAESPAEGKTDSETFMASTAMASHGRRTNAKIFFGYAPRDGETRYE
jgi:hypothetical protein